MKCYAFRYPLALALLLVACHSHAPGIDDNCGEPSYGGEASDEAWYALVDAYDLAEAGADASTFTVPAEGETLTGEAPVALTWSSPLALSCPIDCNPDGFALPLSLEATGPVFAPFAASARAHLPPVTGAIHYLEIFVPGRECPIRAITTDEEWRPTVAEWAELRGKGALRLVITSAYLEKNRIAEGPYRATRTFQVQ